MADSPAEADTNAEATVTPLKDPIARNDAALAGVPDLRGELDREIALRESIESELERETAMRKGFEGELQQERELRTHTEAELQRVTKMVDALNSERLRSRRSRFRRSS